MIVFWLICAILVVIALAFVLPPLLQRGDKQAGSDKEAKVAIYRDQLSELAADLQNGIIGQEQYLQDRDQIERRLLEDVSATDKDSKKKSKPAISSRGPVYVVALGIPVIAIALYLRVGNPGALSVSATAPLQPTLSSGAQPNAQMTQQRIEANVAALAERLKQNPEDAQGWIMLGRSYTTLEKYNEASNAYAKATAIKSDDADLWADYAFALAMANGQRLQGPPLELIKKSLQIDPENPKALQLAGSAEFEIKNYKQAADYWQRLLDKTPRDSELAQTLLQRINEAKSLAGTGAK